IGGKWAVTNAHCIDWNLLVPTLKQTMSKGLENNNVLTLTTVSSTLEIPVVDAYKPNLLLEKDKFGPDIALLKLAFAPQTDEVAPGVLCRREDVIGAEVVCSGYGTLGLGSTGPDRQQFQR